MPEAALPERPRLRPLEAFPVSMDGRRHVALRDPSGYSESVLVVTPETFFAISCLDGSRSIRDVQEACFRRFREIVPSGTIRDLVEKLDEALFLDSEGFRAHRDAVEADFLAREIRPAAHAGGAYDGDPDALRAGLDRLLGEAAAAAPPIPGGPIAALIAPHIDLHRGGPGYGAAYAALRDRCRAETFVVLGTVHASPPSPFTATRKGFETPLGLVESDADFVRDLERRCGAWIFEHEAAHRTEHSIEFQAVWLRHVFAGRRIRIVPLLCSSLHEAIESRGQPRDDSRIASFLDALKGALAGRGDVCLIAAADLAHLGPRFGDRAPVGTADAASCERRDRETLEAAARGDAAGFFSLISGEGDRRRICGVSPIYSMLEALAPGAKGTLLHYGQAIDEGRTTFVSFASMAFTPDSVRAPAA